MLPIYGQERLATHSSRSALEAIAFDDETLIASIAFKATGTHNIAGRTVRWAKRDSKGKNNTRDE